MNTHLMESDSAPQSEMFVPQPGDYIILEWQHVTEQESSSEYRFWRADEIRSLHRQYFIPRGVRDVLVEAIRGYKRHADYTGYYTAFLLGQMTEDEFEKKAEDFIVEPRNNDDHLAHKVAILIDETGEVFPPEQLAVMFSAPGEQVGRVLNQLASRGAIRLND